ncbi:MAG: quinone oxidoreductase family protein [Acidimicrobiales bacterium]
MKAAVYETTGGPEVFRYADVPDPVVRPTEVLVQVEAVSVEGGDTLNRLGGELSCVPHIVGYQCAGTVVGVGVQVGVFAEGDRVVTVGSDGSHAALRSVDQTVCWRIPDQLSVEEAACVPIPFGTAHDCLFEFGRLQPGETVLVHAGAGGVGLAAIQLAARSDATVLATASSGDRLARLGDFGLDHGIDYATTNFVDEVRRITDGRGADVIIDPLGGSVLQRSLSCLAYRGRCITFGDAARETPTAKLDVSVMRAANQALIGYFLGPELVIGTRARMMIARLLDEVASGQLRVVIDRSYPLERAGDAHAYVESRRAFGRVLLIP